MVAKAEQPLEYDIRDLRCRMMSTRSRLNDAIEDDHLIASAAS